MEELEFKQFEKMVMPIYRKEFARRLKQCMLANNIKQVDLVERTGINKSKISSYKKYREDKNLIILEPMSTNPENTTQIYDLKKDKVVILGKVVSYLGRV